MAESRAEQALLDLADLPLTRHPHQVLLPLIWNFRDNLTAYDVTYLALAHGLEATLLTGDAALGSVPGFNGRVDILR